MNVIIINILCKGIIFSKIKKIKNNIVLYFYKSLSYLALKNSWNLIPTSAFSLSQLTRHDCSRTFCCILVAG